MLGNLIGGFIIILIGVSLLPSIKNQISLAQNSSKEDGDIANEEYKTTRKVEIKSTPKKQTGWFPKEDKYVKIRLKSNGGIEVKEDLPKTKEIKLNLKEDDFKKTRFE